MLVGAAFVGSVRSFRFLCQLSLKVHYRGIRGWWMRVVRVVLYAAIHRTQSGRRNQPVPALFGGYCISGTPRRMQTVSGAPLGVLVSRAKFLSINNGPQNLLLSNRSNRPSTCQTVEAPNNVSCVCVSPLIIGWPRDG